MGPEGFFISILLTVCFVFIAQIQPQNMKVACAFILLKGGNFREIEKELEKFSSENGLVGHVSRIENNLQIVLVEKGDYTGNIEHLAYKFKEKISSKSLFETVVNLQASKQAIVKDPLQTAIRHILFYLFITVAILCAVILYYHDYCVNVPFLSLGPKVELGSFRFARFQNESGNLDEGEEILEECPPAHAKEERRQSFYNPIYSKDDDCFDDSVKLSALTQLDADYADASTSEH